ncbi:sulfatase-like hydrolase/transferase [Paenibacillus sp. GCM10012307]|uniref:LTA synthase family protein n=1 Tax=Paenibacillus roseus TaxID=2798579 RepID=A0A934J4N5_9BACL|nr:sulfatase-like hydrolase/transferase [Paenibacillus roseus]MBJ6360350.1 LTA synthase family protein [Paenibacillus roseus]
MVFSKSKLVSSIGYILPLLLLPFLTMTITEVAHRSSFTSFFAWLVLHPGQWASGYLLVFGIMLILLLLLKRIYWAFIVLTLASVSIATISRMKMKYRGEPLLPWDLKLGGEALDVSTFFSAQAILYTLLPIVIVLAIGAVMVWKLPAPNYRLAPRIILAIVGLTLVVGMFGGTMKARKVFALEVINWDQSMNYEQNGMLVGFLLSAQYMQVQEPKEYARAAVEAIQGTSPKPEHEAPSAPNIIMIMSEAFWDPTRLENVAFSRDPLQFFHTLQKESTTGNLLVPVYGGGTVNTEFEALTSLSTQLLPAGSIAYANYVRSPQESLASILKKQGYETMAIHTYHNWFYRRNEVYRLLGFDRFISGEFFSNPEKRSGYIADQEMSRRIIEEVKNTDKPSFIYAVSMENHGPYRLGKNEENTIKVSGLSESSTNILETYIQAQTDVDESLKMLVDAFKDNDEPTIIVFFGDHLPMLGEEYSVYREAGYFQDSIDYDDYLKMYNVPFIMWDNFSSDHKKYDDTYISAFHLAHLTLSKAGAKGNELTDYLSGMFDEGMTFLPRKDFYAQAHINEQTLDHYTLLQYDRLFGEGFSYHGEPPAANEQFQMGSGPITISKAERIVTAAEPLEPNQQSGLIRLTGSHFVSSGIVYINGKQAETTFVSSEEVHAQLPDNTSGTLRISYQVLDSLNRKIAESASFDFTP